MIQYDNTGIPKSDIIFYILKSGGGFTLDRELPKLSLCEVLNSRMAFYGDEYTVLLVLEFGWRLCIVDVASLNTFSLKLKHSMGLCLYPVKLNNTYTLVFYLCAGADEYQVESVAWGVAVTSCVQDGGYMAPMDVYSGLNRYLYYYMEVHGDFPERH